MTSKPRGTENVSIVVVGASGDLARKKIFPALFALYCQGLLPDHFGVFGFSRTQLSDADFRTRITEHLTCRYAPGGDTCDAKMAAFLSRCFYVSGTYASRESFLDLFDAMRREEQGRDVDRVFYLAIPPSLFLDVAGAIGGAGLVHCGPDGPWSRAVIEKPFGRDRESSDALTRELVGVFKEDQTYRIDHYLGKEVIQNLMVLRFANLILEPIWNRTYIEHVTISWKEDLDVSGRGGYFDAYGIIRDVMQNHLLQILSLVAMDAPEKLDAAHVRDEKVRVLRAVPALRMEDVVLGQYGPSEKDGRRHPGYTEEETVPGDSLTPTFAAAVVRIESPRWDGVPFLLQAGKGLDSRMTEIRIRFKGVPNNMFPSGGDCPEANELVIRVQPDEAIYLRLANKIPGSGMRVETRDLDLRYERAFSQEIPEAYENLLLDVLKGEKGLFIRNDELAAAWDVFTPVLHEIEEKRVRPDVYPFGGPGPRSAGALAAKYGMLCEAADGPAKGEAP